MSDPQQYVPLDQVQALIDSRVQDAIKAERDAHAQQLAEVQASQQTAEGTLTAAQVQSIVAEALSQQAEAHNKSMQALAQSMRGSVAALVPAHSGGPGTEIHETWSQYEQGLAQAAANNT